MGCFMSTRKKKAKPKAAKTKQVYFGANINLYEVMLNELGEYFEKLGDTEVRGNNGNISHSAVIAEAIKIAHNLMKAQKEDME